MDNPNFKNALKNESRNLTSLAADGQLTPPAARTLEIERILSLLGRRRSGLLIGPEGVGKTAVIHGLAHTLRLKLGLRLREMSTPSFFTGTRYLGEWETKTQDIANAAIKSSSVLYLTDIWNLPTAGVSSNSTSNLLDTLRPMLQNGDILLLAEVTPEQLLLMQKTPGFVALFEQVFIKPLDTPTIKSILSATAKHSNLPWSEASSQRVITLCQQFLASAAGPGPALTLLSQIKDYHQQISNIGEAEEITPAFIEKIFSIYSGLPLFIVSRDMVKSMRDIRDWFKQKVIGQPKAIDAVIETITLFKAGLHDPNRPIGAFLFVGPTGVGKTELAKAIAHFLFGSERRLLRFDLSEFKDYHAFELLIGDPRATQKPARLADPVRAHPFQVVLFDELEKAHANISDLLLQILDEGRLTPPGGKTINFRNTIIIATSNVGAREAGNRSIGFTSHDDQQATSDKMRHALENRFRPEFLNRFQHIVLFHGLTQSQVAFIANQDIKQLLTREGIATRKLSIEVADDLIAHVVKQGYDVKYGARALKREIQHNVVLPIAEFLMEHPVTPGSVLKLSYRHHRPSVNVIPTAASKATEKERLPIKASDGCSYSRQDLETNLADQKARVDRLSQDLDEPSLRNNISELEQQQLADDFWANREQAAFVVSSLDHLNSALNRLVNLRESLDNIEQRLSTSVSRNELIFLTESQLKLENRLVNARRELLLMGPDGKWDALVHLSPIGVPDIARDMMYRLYTDWAKWRNLDVSLLCNPLRDDEPIFLAIKGAYAYGCLKLESGLHRVRNTDQNSVVRVHVAPWTTASGEVTLAEQRALKKQGQLGGKVRSRLVVNMHATQQFILQNHLSLVANRDLADSLAASWNNAPTLIDEMVRRYDLEPFTVRDYLTDLNTGRKELLKPQRFHTLLCQRIDVSASDALKNYP